MVIGKYISITTLNVNGLNAPNKRRRLVEWIQKQDQYICCPQETPFRPRDIYRLKVRGEKRYCMQMEIKRSWSSNSHTDKIDFK